MFEWLDDFNKENTSRCYLVDFIFIDRKITKLSRKKKQRCVRFIAVDIPVMPYKPVNNADN